jgi:hypothetical protein
MGSALPTFLTNSTNFNASIALANQTVFWQGINEGDSWNGFELIIDDVLRYSGPALNFSLASLQAGIPHFFRLAVSFPPWHLTVVWLIYFSQVRCYRCGGRFHEACNLMAEWDMGRSSPRSLVSTVR